MTGSMSLSPSHRARAHRSWPQRSLLVIGVLLTSLCMVAAGGVGYVYWKLGKLVHFDDLQVADAPPGEPRNYLLVGSDSRENLDPSDPQYSSFVDEDAPGGKRSDTIMLLRVDPEEATAQLLSFPRDLYLDIAGTGRRDRINSAYGQGRQALIDTIQQNFGVEVNHYIEVDFKGFEGLVGAVGGIPMWFDSPMRDDYSGLFVGTPGCVTLDGSQALAFARARALEYQDEAGRWHTDPTADLGRISRQQIFIRRAVTRALDIGITDIGTLNRLLDVAVDNVGLDPTLTLGALRTLGNQFESFAQENLETFALPVTPFRTDGGASVVRISDEAEANRILNIFRGLPPGAVVESEVNVSVRNGTGVPRQAAAVRDALAAVGFAEGDTGDAGGAFATTTIRYAPGSEYAADLLLRHLTAGAVLEVDESLGANALVLVTAADFTTIMAVPRAEAPTTTAPPTTAPASTTTSGPGTATTTSITSTTVIGVTPGEAPPGVECG